MTRATFETNRYEASHGKLPRGRGHWGFCPDGTYARENYLDFVVWADGTYAEAKKEGERR